MSVSAKQSALGRVGTVADGARLQPASRRRSMPLVAVGVLCCLGGALIFGAAYLSADDRQAVLTVGKSLSPGTVIRQSDLGVARIAVDENLPSIPATESAGVVGRKTTVALAPGSLLTRTQIGEGVEIPPGQSVIGLALKPGQFPANLSAGDRILVVTTSGQPGVAAVELSTAFTIPEATVFEVSPVTDPSGATLVSVLVPMTDAPSAAQAAADGRVSLVQLGSP